MEGTLMAFRDGHYVDSGLSQEERDRLDREAQEENNKIVSWDDVPDVDEDQNTD